AEPLIGTGLGRSRRRWRGIWFSTATQWIVPERPAHFRLDVGAAATDVLEHLVAECGELLALAMKHLPADQPSPGNMCHDRQGLQVECRGMDPLHKSALTFHL